MDRDEALRLLRGGPAGVEEWNRRRSAGEMADLNGADLRRADLNGADLREADLIGADLIGADLIGADLIGADLIGADLGGADLGGADLGEANLCKANLRKANLRKADFRGAVLIEADLRRAVLIEADLRGTDLRRAILIEADLRGTDLREAVLSLARLIRCNLDDAIFDEANVTDCHVQETIGRPKPPTWLRVDDGPPLTGEDARNFFNPPATVEVYLTEILTDEELGAFHFHLGDMRRQGVGVGVHLTGEREEVGGTVLRFQAPIYDEIYDVLPILLKPFRMSRVIDWARTYEARPEHERGGVLTSLARIEAGDSARRWPFAERMAEVFGNFPGAKIKYLRDGRYLGVRIPIATNQAMYRKLAQQAGRPRPRVQQQIIYLPVAGQHRIAMEDHSTTNEVNAQSNIVGSSVGTDNTVKARDITAFINTVDQTTDLEPELKRVLVEARKALESSGLTGADKDDAADDLGKLTDEIKKPEPQPSRIKRLFDGITQLAPDIASILSSAAKIGELIKG